MRILAISGSLRRDSHNTRLLRAAAQMLPPGVELEMWERLGDLPHYSEDIDTPDPHPVVAELRQAIGTADAVLIATPEYNHSVPGALKNALDWASRPYAENALREKPAAVIGASTGMFGAVWAQAEVRKVLGAIGAQVLDSELPIGTADEAIADDGLTDPDLADGLAGIIDGLVTTAGDRAAVAA